jgi:hypothetical protein
MKSLSTPVKERDLHDYDNPIKRADGTVPYNGYLWPTESWWPGHQHQFRNIDGHWNFGIIALIDGRFAIDGALCQIEQNTDMPYPQPNDPPGKPVVFDSREKAIRIAAARMIMGIRYLRNRDARRSSFMGMSRETMADVINWTRQIVARETKTPTPKPLSLPPPPPEPPPLTGLELLDEINRRDFDSKVGRNRMGVR